jgi:hypothetical protein
MKALDRRIQRLEIAYEEVLQKKTMQCTLSELVLYCVFPKKWPDPAKAPPLARYAFRRMQELEARRQRAHAKEEAPLAT